MDVKAVAACLFLSFGAWSAAQAEEPYRLGTGDVVKITVFKQPDLSTTARVAENGSITFPLVGEVKVKGLTEHEAEQLLASQLEQKHMVQAPQVNLMVDTYEGRRVSVLGQVAKPGVYAISRDSTVVDLIALAGGLTETAAETAVVSNPAQGARREEVDLTRNLDGKGDARPVLVEDGDRVFVPLMQRFFIYGQVNHPGAYRLDRGMTLMQAMSVAGGLTTKGTERGLSVRRKGPDGHIVSMDVKPTDHLKPDDVVYVDESLF